MLHISCPWHPHLHPIKNYTVNPFSRHQTKAEIYAVQSMPVPCQETDLITHLITYILAASNSVQGNRELWSTGCYKEDTLTWQTLILDKPAHLTYGLWKETHKICRNTEQDHDSKITIWRDIGVRFHVFFVFAALKPNKKMLLQYRKQPVVKAYLNTHKMSM